MSVQADISSAIYDTLENMNKLILLALVAASTLSGCGGDDGSAAFIGTWQYGAGSTTTLTCTGTAPRVSNNTGTFQLAAGTESDIIEVPDAGDTCAPTKFNISGSTATVVPGQSCTTMDAGRTTVASLSSYTLTLGADGKSLTLTANGSATVTGTTSVTCTISLMANATKVGN